MENDAAVQSISLELVQQYGQILKYIAVGWKGEEIQLDLLDITIYVS